MRQALALVHTPAEDFAAEVKLLTAVKVNPVQFKQVIELLFPISDPDSKRAVSNAQNKRDEVMRLYQYDPRVTDWTGTAFGVVQALNTWHQHVQGGLSGSTNEQKSAARANRNTYRAITGETEQNDANVGAVLASVLA